MKILIVDDEAPLRELYALIIGREYNCTIIEAENGERGLQTFINEGADLIITDYSMPEMNGFEMIKAVRAISENVRIIMQSGIYRADAIALAGELNFEFYEKLEFSRNIIKIIKEQYHEKS